MTHAIMTRHITLCTLLCSLRRQAECSCPPPRVGEASHTLRKKASRRSRSVTHLNKHT